jgi:hypothetical protein
LLKNAFQCAYCGLVIHIKCYDKTIEKSVCSRFESKEKKNASNNSYLMREHIKHTNEDESFQEIHSSEVDLMDFPKQQISMQNTSNPSGNATTSKGIVSNLFNTIRQRRSNQHSDTQSVASQPSTSTTSYFKTKYLTEGLNLHFGRTASSANNKVRVIFYY